MKIPISVEITKEKITGYLLVKREENDKSQHLIAAGYSLDEYENLINDLRDQILPLEAVLVDSTEYGDKYEIYGILKSPSGKKLSIKTIWMKEHVTEQWKFITLFPAKGR